jgi:methylmalonyl-CoA mutase N-terminal domain/subunit
LYILSLLNFYRSLFDCVPVGGTPTKEKTVQIEKLKALKQKRNKDKVAACLKTLNEKAISGENLMPAVLEAVENYCTPGEIADELRKVFGEYR